MKIEKSIHQNFMEAKESFEISLESAERQALLEKTSSLRQSFLGSGRVSLEQKELNQILSIYGVRAHKPEGRDFIKSIFNHAHIELNKTYPVAFEYNLLIINAPMIQEMLAKSLEDKDYRELAQALGLIKLHKQKPLEEIAFINSLPFDYTESFLSVIELEEKIEQRIEKVYKFDAFLSHLSPYENDFKIKKEYLPIYGDVFFQLEKSLLKNPLSDNLIEFNKDKICFNHYSLTRYMESGQYNTREMIQALVLGLCCSRADVSDYSHSLFEQKDILIEALKRKVSPDEIKSAVSLLADKYSDLDFSGVEQLLQCEYKDKFLLFNHGEINKSNIDKLFESTSEQAVLYFMIQCFKEDPSMSCKLRSNQDIYFQNFTEAFYLEALLKKELSKQPLNDILTCIHEFKKDKIFDGPQEAIIDKVLAEHFVSRFSHNTNNKEILFINDAQCVFNEKLISKVQDLALEDLVELYLFTNSQLIEELSQNISMDKNIGLIAGHELKISDKIKYVTTERDILNALDKLEKKSNTLIGSRDSILTDLSIRLNAKESEGVFNDVVYFVKKDNELKMCSYSSEVCDKLMQKDLSDVSKREFIQAILLHEAISRDIALINLQKNVVKIHDNFNNFPAEEARAKLHSKITEEEANTYMHYVTSYLAPESLEQLQAAFNSSKRMVGLEVVNSFKHLL